MKWNTSDSAAGMGGAATRHHPSRAASFGATAAQAIMGGAGPSGGAAGSARAGALAAYVPPRLERLGAWNALTLQQSVPIFP